MRLVALVHLVLAVLVLGEGVERVGFVQLLVLCRVALSLLFLAVLFLGKGEERVDFVE